MTPTPLNGRRVLDLSRFISGSVAGQLLADYGAEVVKIEPPGGDPSRTFGRTDHGSIYFRAYNTGKDSVELDLAQADGQQRLEQWLADSDALITNLSPRALVGLSLDWPRLHARHPHVTLGAVTGYGLDDDRTCFDAVAQSESGYARLNAWSDGTPHVAAGYPVDVLAGMQLGVAVGMALCDHLDVGRLVDVAMVEVAASLLCGAHGIQAAETGHTPTGEGNRDRATSPAGVYPCRDGHVYVYGGADPHYGRLGDLIDLPDVPAGDRVGRADQLDAVVADWTRQRTVEQVCAELGALGIPVGPVLDLPQALGLLAAVRPQSVAATQPDGQAVPTHPTLFDGQRVPRRPAPPRPDAGSHGGGR